MNFYKRFMGDYQRDTADLTLAEHGAFSMLLDAYYSNEKPLPMHNETLYRICRASGVVEKHAVLRVANRFFPIDDTDHLRHNARADREIFEMQPKIKAARMNGAKGGRKPRSQEPTG